MIHAKNHRSWIVLERNESSRMGRNSFYILSFGFTFSTLNFKFSSTTVMSALQISPFCSNKPNFRKSQMNVNNVLTKDYEIMDTWWSGKNKPNSKPIQTQYKANSKPIQTQNKAKQTQFQRQKMTAPATNRNTWKTKAEYSTIAMQSLKSMNEEKYE